MSENTSGLFPVQGNGDLTTEDRTVGPFAQVVNSTSVSVTITEGAQSLSVTVDSNLQPLLITTVTDNVLTISTEEPIKASPNSKVQVALPALTGVKLSGAGGVSATVTTAQNISLTLSGSGPLTFRGPANAVEAKNSGFGPMQLSGTAESLVATLSGAGALNTQDLPVSGAAQITNSGAGPLTATANGTVSLKLTGLGNITWYGTATVTSSHDSGLGKIVHIP
jgi:hypothetical protein